MKPNSREHDEIAALSPGDADKDGLVECQQCGHEAAVNKAAVVIRERYTCPECGHTKRFDNHAGTALLVLIVVVLLSPFFRLYNRLTTNADKSNAGTDAETEGDR